MSDQEIRFDDGASYEKMMGGWSRLAGEVFLDWLKPAPGLNWVDVGCGNGAFTELIVERCAPVEVQGVDPSEGQLAFARQRHKAGVAHYRIGDAMALPFPDKSFDAASMALVIFFVPEPARGVAEMARVVRPGGTVAAYAWDMDGDGFPLQPINEAINAFGLKPRLPPSVDAARTENLRTFWTDAGLTGIETREIVVERRFRNFEDFWATLALLPGLGPLLAPLSAADRDGIKARVREKVAAKGDGPITRTGRANAVKGVVPK